MKFLNRYCAATFSTNHLRQVRRIMAAQMPRQARLDQADYVIDNSGDLSALDPLVAALHRELLQRAGTGPG